MRRRFLALLVVAVLASMGAQHRTPNFIVYASTAQVAQQVGQWAEHYRKEKALLWLGQEMPQWGQPCPLQVNVTMGPPSGATTFQFGQGAILSMKMEIQGPLDRLIQSVLPHEITHTVFAYRFRCPVPRWADEGGSVLSEDDQERDTHDKLTRKILNEGRQIPLRRLLPMTEYPREVHCLYAQGYSVTDYLVKRSDRKTFLNFVGQAMNSGWDNAIQSYYGHRSVEEMEQAWLKHLRDTKHQPGRGPEMIAQNEQPKTPGIPTGNGRRVQLTAPPAQPFENSSIIRAAGPGMEPAGQRFGDLPSTPPIVVPTPRAPSGATGWQPVDAPPPPPSPGGQVRVRPVPPAGFSPVQLGPPQFGAPTVLPRGASPIGFPQ